MNILILSLILSNFAEVLAENQSKNINRISTEIGRLMVNRSSGVTTISVNPNNKSTGQLQLALTLLDTPQGPMTVERRIEIVTVVRVKLI